MQKITTSVVAMVSTSVLARLSSPEEVVPVAPPSGVAVATVAGVEDISSDFFVWASFTSVKLSRSSSSSSSEGGSLRKWTIILI